MTINCEDTGFVPYEINPDDQFQISFDISTWLDTDTISSVAYSAVDENGDDASSDVLDAGIADHNGVGELFIGSHSDGRGFQNALNVEDQFSASGLPRSLHRSYGQFRMRQSCRIVGQFCKWW